MKCRGFVAVLLLALLAGCATPQARPHCFDCGTVRSVDVMSAPGQVAVPGTLGDSARGSPGRSYRVTVDMDNGGIKTVVVMDYVGIDRGTRVRVLRGGEIEVIDPADDAEP